MKKILILSDNLFLAEQFVEIYKSNGYPLDHLKIGYNPKGSPLSMFKNIEGVEVLPMNVKLDYSMIVSNFDMVFSIHCKQLFPKELVEGIKCINVHPGLNPFNRGWFPQVFSILNKLPLGATIHEIDEELDHGPIIAQQEVRIDSSDTSLSAYEKVQQAEVELLKKYLPQLMNGNYQSTPMPSEGNLNLKKDFDALCELDLSKTQTIGETIDLLRALTHGDYKNGWFLDPTSEEKVYISIQLSN
jgi:methionyl-tRNA formyltransferase